MNAGTPMTAPPPDSRVIRFIATETDENRLEWLMRDLEARSLSEALRRLIRLAYEERAMAK